MLHVPRQSYQSFTFDNWGADPSLAPGTAVTPGASSAEGSWTQIASSANIAQDIYGIYLQVHNGATGSAIKLHVLDLGVDPAGGTSYSAVISDLVCGNTAPLSLASTKPFYFPLFIKAGSSVAVRVSGSNATAGTISVVAKFYGYLSGPVTFPVGAYSESYGVTGTSGTVVTPGNAADGSWTLIGTTASPIWWWQLGYQINNSVVTAEYTYLELAVGDASNKKTVFKAMHGGQTTEISGFLTHEQTLWHAAYQPAPASTNVYVRARCNNAPDTGYQVGVIGIGG